MKEDVEVIRRLIRDEKYLRSDARQSGNYAAVDACTYRIDSLQRELRELIEIEDWED